MGSRIDTTKDFFAFLEKYSGEGEKCIFRGVRKKSYKLIPAVGRMKKPDGTPLDLKAEKILLKLFKQKAYPQIKDYEDDNLALLSIAQHHGLPTRLLDWTKNPLVALYFAVKAPFETGETEEDSIIYIYKPRKKVNLEEKIDPFKIDKVERFIPKYWNPRIIAQDGLFTVHNNPNEAWEAPEIDSAFINYEIRKSLKSALNKFGIHEASMFPDIDGVTRYLTYLRTNAY